MLYKFEDNEIKLVYQENHPKTFYDSMDFWNDQEGIAITTDFFDFRTDTLSFKTNAARINCDQANGLPDDMGSYFQSCLETAQISSKEKTKIDMEFTIDEPKTEEAEAFFLNLTGGISALNMENERILLKKTQSLGQIISSLPSQIWSGKSLKWIVLCCKDIFIA